MFKNLITADAPFDHWWMPRRRPWRKKLSLPC